MPVTKSASKKLRRDQRVAVVNLRRKRALKNILKKAQQTHAAETVRQAIAAIDKAVKAHLFHKNKAARMKSQLMKQAKAAPAAKTTPKSSKKAGVKKATKAKAKKTAKK